jgi:prefoldin alpha subunit
MEKEELQKLYLEYKTLEQQTSQIEQQLQTVEQQLQEAENIKGSLDDLKEVKQGSELLVPVSSGIFMKAKISSKDKVIVNVGSDVLVGKGLDGAKQLMDKQKKEIENVRDSMVKVLYELNMKGRLIQGQLMREQTGIQKKQKEDTKD